MRRAWQGIRWYLRELTGESQYDRYLARYAEHAEHAKGHAGTAPLSRKEFERARQDRTPTGPGSRCC